MAPDAETDQDDRVGDVPGAGAPRGPADRPNNGIQRDIHPGTSGSADVVLAFPNFELIVKQQDFDPRESQVEYVVQVTNPSQRSVRLLSLRQSVPPGVEVQHVRDSTLTSQREH